MISMLTYAKLAQQPQAFETLTGVSVSKFDGLCEELKSQYQIHEVKRLSQKERKRQIGAGRKFTLPVTERALMALIRNNCRPTYHLLQDMFGLDYTAVMRGIQKIEPVIKACNGMPPKLPGKKKLSSLEDLEEFSPGIRALMHDIEDPAPEEEKTAKKRSILSRLWRR